MKMGNVADPSAENSDMVLQVPSVDIDPFSPDFLADPYHAHAALRDAGPVIWLPRYRVYAAARHAEVTRALSDHISFGSARGVGLADFAVETPWRPPSLLLETDPPVHDRTRGIMSRVVTIARIRALQPHWQSVADTLVDEIVTRGHCDAVVDIAEEFPMRIFPDAVGLPREGREHLLVYAATVFNAFGPRNAIYEEAVSRSAAAIAWVAQACRRENLHPDGWGMEIYRAADAGNCTNAEAERLVRSLLSAGVDTTVNALGNLLHGLVYHTAQWERLCDDPAYFTKRAFEEALRWESTVQTFFRTTNKAVNLRDTRLPAGAKILLFLAAANRDPRRWPNPDSFDIARQTSGHVAFGMGIHQCLGQMVARAEAEVLLKALITRVQRWSPAGPLKRRLNNTLYTISSLPARIEPVIRG